MQHIERECSEWEESSESGERTHRLESARSKWMERAATAERELSVLRERAEIKLTTHFL